jgi:hypothetical protein
MFLSKGKEHAICRRFVRSVEGVTLQEIFVFTGSEVIDPFRRVDGIADDLIVFCEQIFYKVSIGYCVKLNEY